jgi:cold-inducible RNA-binding protein
VFFLPSEWVGGDREKPGAERTPTDNRFKSLINMKLYVGNVSFAMTEHALRELFEPFGTVSEVKLFIDRETGQSRGFGFVTMDNASEGNAAIKGLDGKDKGGRTLKVNEARPKDDRGGRPFPGARR